MTRFNITLDDGVKMVLWALENSIGSEIFVPKIPSYRILDLAKAINPNAEIEIIGVRPGEKLHEEMISSSDSAFTFDLGEYYAVLQQGYDEKIEYYSKKGFKKVDEGFSYNSGSNTQFLNVNEIKELIRLNIDNNFE
jgi:FlaA1/EpsC-like NDP-sugar epimerase